MNICPAIGDTVNYPTSSAVLILIFLIFYMHIRGLFVVGFEFILKKNILCLNLKSSSDDKEFLILGVNWLHKIKFKKRFTTNMWLS